jgi:hypothetical protein
MIGRRPCFRTFVGADLRTLRRSGTTTRFDQSFKVMGITGASHSESAWYISPLPLGMRMDQWRGFLGGSAQTGVPVINSSSA